MIIENLFPTPIGFFKYGDTISEEFLYNQQKIKNLGGNFISEDKYVLKNLGLSDLNIFIESSIQEYFMTTYCPKNDVRLKITQSWINWSNMGEYHHLHHHSNSVISGVYYINANKEMDSITFYNNINNTLKFTPIDWTMYNSESWSFSVGTGDLILFPSSLRHGVNPVKNSETRISLAFNTFPIGYVGEESNLTALYLQ